jgi:hypothetical protein
MSSSMEALEQEIEKYASANKGKNIDNPMSYVAAIGIARLTSLVREANETGSVLVFSYKGRQLTSKFTKAAGKR